MNDPLSHLPDLERISAMMDRADRDSPLQLALVKLAMQLRSAELRRSLVVSETLSKQSLRAAARASAEALIQALKAAGIDGPQRQAVVAAFWPEFAKIIDGTQNTAEPAQARLRGPIK
jgi:hypothetical protein